MVKNLGHCWSGNDCCDNQCVNQSPDNMDFSIKALDFFNEVSRTAGRKVNATKLAADLRARLG